MDINEILEDVIKNTEVVLYDQIHDEIIIGTTIENFEYADRMWAIYGEVPEILGLF